MDRFVQVLLYDDLLLVPGAVPHGVVVFFPDVVVCDRPQKILANSETNPFIIYLLQKYLSTPLLENLFCYPWGDRLGV